MTSNNQNNYRKNKAKQEKLDSIASESSNKGEIKQESANDNNKNAAELYEKKYKRLRKFIYKCGRSKWDIEKKINILELTGAIIAVFALIYLIDQSKELKKTNKIATKSLNLTKESMIYGMRAYVFVDSLKIKKRKNGEIIALIYMSNSGQTPAFRTEFYANASIDSIKCLENLKFPLPQGITSKIFLGSGATKVIVIGLNKPNTQIGIRKNGKNFFHIYGTIKYFDVFDSLRITTYSSVFDTARNTFIFCPNNNDEKRNKKKE